MKELSPLEKQAKEAMIEILQDVVQDYKRNAKRLQAIIILLIVLLAGTFVYYEWSFKSFLSQYDIENTVTQEFQANGETDGNVNISDINKNSVVKK